MTHLFKFILVLFLSIFTFASCDDDEPQPSNVKQLLNEKKDINLIGSKWREANGGNLWFEFINAFQVRVYRTDENDQSKINEQRIEKYQLDYPRIYIGTDDYGFTNPNRMGRDGKRNYLTDPMDRVK